MSKLFAAAAGKDSLLTRRARKRSEASHAARAPQLREEPRETRVHAASPEQNLDPDMLEWVRKFDATYSELTPSMDETPQRHDDGGDLFPEFPDIFSVRDDKAAAVASVPAGRSERAPLWRPDTLPAPRRERGPEIENEIDLDEALALLNAPQTRRAQAAQPQAGEERPVEESAERSMPRRQRESVPDPRPIEAEAAWSTKAHRPHSIAITAAVVALVVGIGVGYVAGHPPGSSKPKAAVAASQQAGAKLRLDYDLQKR